MPQDMNPGIPELPETGQGLNANGNGEEVIVKYNGDLTPVEKGLGITAELLGDSYAILTLRPENIPELYSYKQIEYIELPKILTLAQQEAMSAACITQVRGGSGYGLTGRGVIVGIIDSGIDYAHPDFREQNGDSRVLYLWDQTGTGMPPAGFQGGVEYDNSALNAILKNRQGPGAFPASDTIGHGTAVAGIAAGNGRQTQSPGTAPEASLIVVKLGERGRASFARTTEIMRALKYITDKATALNMPVAINVSFGTNNGSHLGNSLFETYIDEVTRRWKCVIVAATGNEGAAGHHFDGRVGQDLTLDASFTVAGGVPSVYLSMWKNFADTFDIELIAPGGASSGRLNPEESVRRIRLESVDVTVYYGQPFFYNVRQEIFIRLDGGENGVMPGIWRLLVTGRQVLLGAFDVWLPTTEEVGAGTAFLNPSPSLTMTLPSTTEGVLSVGGYNSATGAAAGFSGRGEIISGAYVKPDIVAPSVNVISAKAGGGRDAFTGTSMAAPFVTGATALLMEWGITRGNDPFLYGQRVKAFLQKNAARELAIPYPDPVWGYGTLCLKAALDDLQRYKN